MQLKVKNKRMFLIAVLIMCTGTQFFSFGGNTAVSPLLQTINGYHLYSLVAALGSAGTMIALPAVGAIGDKTGRRNIILLGAGMMLLARVAIQFTNDPYVFMIWQFLGSAGAGCVMSAPYSMIASVFERSTAMKYYGFVATFNALGSLAGPVVAGALIDAGYGRLPFLLWIPFYIFSIVVIVAEYPNNKKEGSKFDVRGLTYLAGVVITFVLWTGLSGAGKPLPWLSIGLILPGAMVLFAVLLVRRSKTAEKPAVPMHMFARKRFRIAFFCNLMMVAFSTCATGYLLNYILYVMRKSATLASTSTVPMTLATAICGVFMGSILARNFTGNVRPMMITSVLCILAALICFSLLQPTSPMFLIWIGSALGGVGNSIAQTSLTPFIQYGIQPEEVPAAQGMYQFSGTGGATVFVAIVGVLVSVTGSIKPVFYAGLVLAVINVFWVIAFLKISPEEIAAVEGTKKP